MAHTRHTHHTPYNGPRGSHVGAQEKNHTAPERAPARGRDERRRGGLRQTALSHEVFGAAFAEKLGVGAVDVVLGTVHGVSPLVCVGCDQSVKGMGGICSAGVCGRAHCETRRNRSGATAQPRQLPTAPKEAPHKKKVPERKSPRPAVRLKLKFCCWFAFLPHPHRVEQITRDL